MAVLTIRQLDGTSEKRELSRSQPLTIGRQQFNEICIPENDVGPLHCRISWNKTCFEVTAATSNGVELNATTVSHMNLKSGDLIRVGSVDLIFQDEPVSAKPPTLPTGAETANARRPRPRPEPVEKPVEELSLYDGQIDTESQAMMKALAEDEVQEDAALKQPKLHQPVAKLTGAPRHQLRPGEQEILKSPLVLGMTFGGLALLLVTAVFWFLISREQSNRLYDRGVREMNEGQLAQAATTFERFIAENPNHGLRRQADRGLAKTLILKEIAGATPAWKRGLERLNEFIKAHRNDADFMDLQSAIFTFADQIALGAAKSAETTRDPELLVISQEARGLVERYADPANPPTGSLGRINEQKIKAERAIEKQKTFDIAIKVIDTAITEKLPMKALSERERLVRLFPDFVGTKRVKDALQQSLDLERSVVSTDKTERRAETTDDPAPPKAAVLALFQTRTRTDESSAGRVVFAIGQDSCYAIDSATGDLVWRRIIGANTPFFPVMTNGAQSLVLLFDTRKQALLACQSSNGALVWRQPLNARAIGKPLVHEAQIYLAVEGHALVRIDLDSGRLSAQVKFSQDLAASPTLSRDGEYLLVPGQMAMIYSLLVRAKPSHQALDAIATTFTDHAAGSISTPPLSMGHLLLLCENDLADSARLRLWDASQPEKALTELASTRISGQVRDTPVLRGNQLVVPSSGEQFAAFVVTDDAGRAGLAPIGQYRAQAAPAKGQPTTPLFVALGSDGQFWSAGPAFRRFEIGSNNIRMDSNFTAAGIASQPLQLAGDQFYVGRHSLFSHAVIFSAVEREKLVSPWRCTVGDAPLELLATKEGNVVWIGESGTVYTISKNRLAQGGFDMKAGAEMELPNKVIRPVQASILDDQRLVAFASGDSTQMAVINSLGQTINKIEIKDLPEANPVLLDEGLVLPLPGRLKLTPLSSSKSSVQDWIAPVGESLDHRWAHLVRIDGKELIACDDTGRLMRVQFRQGDVPHLAEVAKLQLDQPVDVRPVIRGDFLYVADAGGTCRRLRLSSFDTDGQSKPGAPIENLWATVTNILVHTADGKLRCLADTKDLAEKWVYDLKGLHPCGPLVLRNDAAWLACREGTIVVINSISGQEIRRIVLPQSLSLGLRQAGENLLAIGVDGTVYPLD